MKQATKHSNKNSEWYMKYPKYALFILLGLVLLISTVFLLMRNKQDTNPQKKITAEPQKNKEAIEIVSQQTPLWHNI